MILFADSSALRRGTGDTLQFAYFDDRLVKAAEVLGVGSSPVR